MSAIFGLFNPRLGVTYSSDVTGVAAILGVQFNGWACEIRRAMPDASNAKIAELIGACLKETHLPVFVQTQQAIPLRTRRGYVPKRNEYRANSKKHVATHVFLKWAAEHVHALGKGNRVIIYGHRHQLQRVAVLARYYGLDPVFPHDCQAVPYDPLKRLGAQTWAKTPWRYIPWDYIVGRPGTLALWALRKL